MPSLKKSNLILLQDKNSGPENFSNLAKKFQMYTMPKT